MDIATLLGIVLAIGSIIGGQALEGGHLSSIMQLTAFIIVAGGTIGACCVQNPLSVVIKSIGSLGMVFGNTPIDTKATIKLILDLATVSRKQGLLALEGKLKDIKDPFFKKGVQLIVDGTDPKAVHEILEIEVEHHEEAGVKAAKVWEAAGGYAPTVGILGAVLGLIHVMENLADPSKLGGGIAVAFVATVYGVGLANLFFLPFANKIKMKLKEESGARNIIIMGLVGLAQGENPRLLQEKLESFLPHEERSKEAKK
ncbi:flagellar motor protein [Nitrospira lenta]|uniref:Flagellar motor protein MotA n=1 Tax=Nitrospira lenta TaxID=1436998 RepID=A0A330L7A4_9BACT|nr:flagellar motor protein [Nitrospira lenta]MCC6141031.1 flagellar motor protein [Nitrospira sp.]ULA63082.1 MAG: Flagellar motor rotation protein MotA [Nitrospira sp.]SPP65131.1 Flagellar motor protein MotA [Nitrospira lenta]